MQLYQPHSLPLVLWLTGTAMQLSIAGAQEVEVKSGVLVHVPAFLELTVLVLSLKKLEQVWILLYQ